MKSGEVGIMLITSLRTISILLLMEKCKFYVLWFWRCSRKLAESIAWNIIQKMWVDYIVSSTCCNWDRRVSHLWRTIGVVRFLLGIRRESVWTAKDTGSWCSIEGYSSSMVGDTQTDNLWLGEVPQIDDGPLWRCRGLSCWEISLQDIWGIKWAL